MFEKIFAFLIEKFAPVGILATFFITVCITVFEVKYFQLSDPEEIVLYFFSTFTIGFFIFLLIAKIVELSKETPVQLEHQGEHNE